MGHAHFLRGSSPLVISLGLIGITGYLDVDIVCFEEDSKLGKVVIFRGESFLRSRGILVMMLMLMLVL